MHLLEEANSLDLLDYQFSTITPPPGDSAVGSVLPTLSGGTITFREDAAHAAQPCLITRNLYFIGALPPSADLPSDEKSGYP